MAALAFALVAGVAMRSPALARADEPGAAAAPAALRPRWAPIVGALTLLVPLAAASVLWSHDSQPDLQHPGVYLATAGFIAAPVLADGMTGRWKRAAAFGVAALVTSAAAWTSMAVKDPFRPSSTKEGLPFMLAFTTSFFAAAAGVIDSAVLPAGEPR